MNGSHIDLIPSVLKPARPTQFDGQSFTVLEMVSNMASKMNECVTEFNAFVDAVNATCEEFTGKTVVDNDLFQRSIEQKFQDFIGVIELKHKGQNKAINDIATSVDEAVEAVESGLKDYVDEALAGSDSGVPAVVKTPKQWESYDDVLKAGQLGIQTFSAPEYKEPYAGKVGDGVTPWSELPFIWSPDAMWSRGESSFDGSNGTADDITHREGYYYFPANGYSPDRGLITLMGGNRFFIRCLENTKSRYRLQIAYGHPNSCKNPCVAYRCMYGNGPNNVWSNWIKLVSLNSIDFTANNGSKQTTSPISTASGTESIVDLFTATKKGLYFISGYVEFIASNTTGYRSVKTTGVPAFIKLPPIAGSTTNVPVNCSVHLEPNEVFKLHILQNAGTNVDVNYNISWHFIAE